MPGAINNRSDNAFQECQSITVKSGIIVLDINIVTTPLAFLSGPILVNMRDVDVLQK
jgi:hypothetical protein